MRRCDSIETPENNAVPRIFIITRFTVFSNFSSLYSFSSFTYMNYLNMEFFFKYPKLIDKTSFKGSRDSLLKTILNGFKNEVAIIKFSSRGTMRIMDGEKYEKQ